MYNQFSEQSRLLLNDIQKLAAIQSYYYIAYALVEDTYINSDSDYTEELHKCRNHLLRKDLIHKDI